MSDPQADDSPPLSLIFAPVSTAGERGVACRRLSTVRCGTCAGEWRVWHDDTKGQHRYQHLDDQGRIDCARTIDDWQLDRDFRGDIFLPILRHYGPHVHPPSNHAVRYGDASRPKGRRRARYGTY